MNSTFFCCFSDLDVLSMLGNFNDELPEDLINQCDLVLDTDTSNSLINHPPPQQVTNATPPQQQQQQTQQQQQNAQTSSTPQPIQQGSPIPNALNQQRPPLSSPQPPASVSTSGAPTPAMPCVSSTPTHNVASSATGPLNTRSPLQVPLSGSAHNQQQQMTNHPSNTAHFTSSSYNPSMPPHNMSMGGGAPHMQQIQHGRLRPPGHTGGAGGMTGPLTVGMHNQPHPMGGVHPGMHSAIERRMMQGHMGGGGMQMPGGHHQYIHPSQHPGHHQGMLPGMPRHHMVQPGMPSQPPQMGGHQSAMGHMMQRTTPHMQPNMIHHQARLPHMMNMHGGHAGRFAMGGNPNAIRAVPNPAGGGGGGMMMPDNSQLPGSGAGMPGGNPNPLQNMSQQQQQQPQPQQQVPNFGGMSQALSGAQPGAVQQTPSTQTQQQQGANAVAASQGPGQQGVPVGAASPMPGERWKGTCNVHP